MSFSPREIIYVEQLKDTREGQKSPIYHDRDQNRNIGHILIKVLITLPFFLSLSSGLYLGRNYLFDLNYYIPVTFQRNLKHWK